ncbi:hypothetical protein [Streptomyces mobaraensis]|uniref:Secreted protein n=1 Tax=Streptomyces mobaraensis (strain ATCC 29032 / DSM 40847 / JCM 4168 / NBRC 13819 / NCIMB 11159 / IPCR 16-22) TaxID=1223523 RepID=M3B3J2_STRM1|nr:hypothetical protein [Streptomyces mobaraensis]EMF00528.1 hypothetical protein H340_10825 [Streptomyces mobaraensis NBRC 13819 = DSM 40847]
MSMRNRVVGVALALLAGGMVLGQAGTAMADDHHGRHHEGHGLGSLPVAIVSPAPGQITKEHKVTDTYKYDPKGGSSSSSSSEEQPPSSGSSAPSTPEPGPVTALKDTANSTAQSATSGVSSTADAALK